MMEMFCTLRCDGCGATRTIVMRLAMVESVKPRVEFHVAPIDRMPAGWRHDDRKQLLCPRCPAVP